MKRILSFFVLASVLLASSCSLKEDFKGNDSEFAQLSFTIGGPNASATRAIGDGTSVDMLQYAIYDADDVLIRELGKAVDGVTFPTQVDITLAKGQTYKIAFWAQNSTCGAYSIEKGDVRNVAISYDGYNNNDENRDAFFKTIEHTVTGDIALDVTLERPFAQINLGVTEEDWNDAVKAGIEVKQSKVSFNEAATGLDLFDGSVSGKAEVNYLLTNIPSESLYVDLEKDGEKEAYRYLSLSYILVNADDKALVDAVFTLDTNKEDVEVKVDNLPVQRNWRTNVIGRMLTGDITFNIDIDPIFDGDVDNYPDNDAEMLYFAGLNGGTVILKGDVLLENGSIDVYKDMIVDLNGYAIRNKKDGDYCNVFVAYEGANLVIKDTKGTGIVETEASSRYAIPVWACGGNIKIYGGNYYSNGKGNGGSEVIYASGKGNVTITGGLFQAKEQSSDVSNQWLALNCHDASYRNGTANIIVMGGMFYKFNPANNLSEGVGTNYVVENYDSRQVGDYWEVVLDAPDFVLNPEYIEAYSAEGLLKWAYMAQNNKEFGLKIMNDIVLPLYTVELDAANETYRYTSTAIDVENGVPSGSNWIPVGTNLSTLTESFSGHIEGNNHTIIGMRLNSSKSQVGFVGALYDDASIKNLNFDDAVVYSSASDAGIAVGRSQNGGIIDNVHIRNSSIIGVSAIGGVVGRNYTRGNNQHKEALTVLSNCSTDANTKVLGTSDQVGGICGVNYGALVVNCLNRADVTGYQYVGGVVGYLRDYHHYCDGFVIASGSTYEAVITPTKSSGSVGGVVGYSLHDGGHTDAYSLIIGCFSESVCNNAILGGGQNTSIYGTWGVGTNSFKHVGDKRLGVILYTDATQCTQLQIDEMNAAIDAFNALQRTTLIDNVLVQCDKKWSYVSGSYPVLQ